MDSAQEHQRGEEANALADLSRRMREGTLETQGCKKSATQASHTAGRGPAAIAVALPAEERKQKKHKSKRKHADGDVEEEPAAAAAAQLARGKPAYTVARLLDSLRQSAVALHQAAEQAPSSEAVGDVQSQLAALTACTSRLCNALDAAGSVHLPAALHLLQLQLAQATATLSSSLAAPPLPALELGGFSLQAEAAAAAIAQQQVAEDDRHQQHGWQQEQHEQQQQQQEFSSWYMSTFADCYAAEVEALQEAEPPIPTGVLLQCVCMAAGSRALFTPQHRALALQPVASDA